MQTSEPLSVLDNNLLADSYEIGVNPSDVRARAAWDINFFAGMCIPSVFRFPFPEFYVALFNFILLAIERKDPAMMEKVLRIAVGLPRGFAKSTFLKILVCYLIVHDKISFILIICATEDLAENFIEDVHDILSSPNVESIYGM